MSLLADEKKGRKEEVSAKKKEKTLLQVFCK